MDRMNLSELLASLAGPGAIALVAWFASWLLDELAAWQALPAKIKSVLILVVSSIIGIGAVFVMQRPEIYAPLEPYAQVVLAIIGAWLSTQVAYRVRRE